MDWQLVTATRLDELTKPKSTGKPVNPHVVPHQPMPKPDYEKMRDLTQGKNAVGEKQAGG